MKHSFAWGFSAFRGSWRLDLFVPFLVFVAFPACIQRTTYRGMPLKHNELAKQWTQEPLSTRTSSSSRSRSWKFPYRQVALSYSTEILCWYSKCGRANGIPLPFHCTRAIRCKMDLRNDQCLWSKKEKDCRQWHLTSVVLEELYPALFLPLSPGWVVWSEGTTWNIGERSLTQGRHEVWPFASSVLIQQACTWQHIRISRRIYPRLYDRLWKGIQAMVLPRLSSESISLLWALCDQSVLSWPSNLEAHRDRTSDVAHEWLWLLLAAHGEEAGTMARTKWLRAHTAKSCRFWCLSWCQAFDSGRIISTSSPCFLSSFRSPSGNDFEEKLGRHQCRCMHRASIT